MPLDTLPGASLVLEKLSWPEHFLAIFQLRGKSPCILSYYTHYEVTNKQYILSRFCIIAGAPILE